MALKVQSVATPQCYSKRKDVHERKNDSYIILYGVIYNDKYSMQYNSKAMTVLIHVEAVNKMQIKDNKN